MGRRKDASRKAAGKKSYKKTPAKVAIQSSPAHGADPAGDTVAPSHIVGIGASAGGLEALERFFERVPIDTGMAFVVVQHLSPDFKSMMDELLGRRTNLPVHRVEHGMQVEANAVYLIPPKMEMAISEGRLTLTEKDLTHGISLPIDVFFESLAREAGRRAIAIVLSGTGSDGSRGIQSVRSAGGLVIAQKDKTARFDGMPLAAEATGAVHLVLAPEEIPSALSDHASHPFAKSDPAVANAEMAALSPRESIFELLRDKYSLDFSLYKPSTVNRRIDRRIDMSGCDSLAEYVDRLKNNPGELNQLYRDLLIGVTKFFRDQKPFERLETDIIPKLIQKTPDGEELRVWVAGCATGEEAYSLAILLHEQLTRQNRSIPVKIFATDVHRTSLEFAGAGQYEESSLTEVTPERLNRYFTKRGARYQVSQDLRQMIVFASHNLTKNAPFTKIDLVSCRNLLIYLESEPQKKILALFYFALRYGGILFLGPSETVGDLSDVFENVDAYWKIYRKISQARLPAETRFPLAAAVSRLEPPVSLPQPTPHVTPVDHKLLRAYDSLLESYIPASVLIDENREIVHVFGDAQKLLTLPGGRISHDLLDMVSDEMRIAIGAAIPRAKKEGHPITYKGVRMPTQVGDQVFNLTVKPVPDRRSDSIYILIVLEAQEAPKVETDGQSFVSDDASGERIQTLESELRYTKENLQATIEELETSNEEMQATNEELQATNQELLASNEELQSTNEELHSVNEELYTVNAEYQQKIDELTQLTNDVNNLLASTEIGTIFLDRSLCVRKFTPAITQAFNLLPQDIGRPISHFSNNVDHPGLLDDVKHVLETKSAVEIEVQNHMETWFLLRILPYLSGDDTTEGIVLTFIDISTIKQAQKELLDRDERLNLALSAAQIGTWAWNLTDNSMIWDDRLHAIVGLKPGTFAGKYEHFLDTVHPEDLPALKTALSDTIHNNAQLDIDFRTVWPDESVHYIASRAAVHRDDNEVPIHMIGVCLDVTKLKQSEAQLQQFADELENTNQVLKAKNEELNQFASVASHELRAPIRSLVSFSQILKEDHASILPEEALGQLDTICNAASRMQVLVAALLDFSQTGTRKMTRQKVALVDCTDHVLTNLAERIQSTAAIIECDVLPEVDGDPVMIEQLYQNLIDNALKFSSERTPQVRITAEQDGSQVILGVRDSGIGVQPDYADQIFHPFRRLHSRRQYDGTGIGLAICHKVVERHGGRIWVESVPGKGAHFKFTLPGQPMGENHGE